MLTVRLTKDELHALAGSANAAGKSTSEFARDLLREDPKRMNVWLYRNVRVETPLGISHELWQRLRAYVDLLEPAVDALRKAR